VLGAKGFILTFRTGMGVLEDMRPPPVLNLPRLEVANITNRLPRPTVIFDELEPCMVAMGSVIRNLHGHHSLMVGLRCYLAVYSPGAMKSTNGWRCLDDALCSLVKHHAQGSLVVELVKGGGPESLLITPDFLGSKLPKSACLSTMLII
jgi:hypothetical protein